MAKRKTKTPSPDSLDHITPALRQFAVPIDSISQDPLNPNSHGEGSIEAIAASLKANGQVTPILVREQNRVIIAGNGRHTAGKLLGWTHIAAILLPFDSIQAARFAIVDNRSAEFSEWNTENIAALRTALEETDSWDDINDLFLLEELCPPPADEEDDTPPGDPPTPAPPAIFVQAKMGDEAQAQALFRRLKKQGYDVSVKTT